jgi:hypothetical protein
MAARVVQQFVSGETGGRVNPLMAAMGPNVAGVIGSAVAAGVFLALLLAIMLVVFAAFWFLPVGSERFFEAVRASLSLAKWYAQEHVLLCLVPAFFIAGAISVFVSQGAVMRYLGPGAKKLFAYPVAAVSGVILAVCSCTVLPLFASIHKRGAGLGPAIAFLYSGPAINVLAIILTARILGPELGIARAVGAIAFAVVIGLAMHLAFRREEAAREAAAAIVLPDDRPARALWQDASTSPASSASWCSPTGAPRATADGGLGGGARAALGDHGVRWRSDSPPCCCAGSSATSSPAGSTRAGASPSRSCRCCSVACWSPASCSADPPAPIAASSPASGSPRRWAATRSPPTSSPPSSARSCTSRR